MADYYERTYPFTPFTKVRGTEVKFELDGVQGAFEKLPASARLHSGSVNYVEAGGSANALTAQMPSPWTGYAGKNGSRLTLKIAEKNTGSVTLSIDGLSEKPVRRNDGKALVAGDFRAGAIYDLLYDEASDVFRVHSAWQGLIDETESQANLATQKAGEAVNSASAAASSASSAESSATDSASSATAAEQARQDADSARDAAQGHSQDAQDSADAAQGSANTAATKADDAAQSAADALAIYGSTSEMEAAVQSAEDSATAAAASENNASDSAGLAADWATKTDGTVDGTEYSAKHHAQASADSASSAASSAAAASTSESNAATSESNAAVSEASASNSADSAANSATAADSSATTASAKADEAGNHASDAANSATTASTKASEASDSADAALAIYGSTSEMEAAVQSADDSATAASGSASNASASADLAEDWASNTSGSVDGTEYSAKHHAQEAASSASTADSSASSASDSAADAADSKTVASNSASAAATSESNAADSASLASAAASDAADSEVAAANSALSASNKADEAEGHALTAEDAASSAVGSASTAESASAVAQSSANFKGPWTDLSGALDMPASVSHDSQFWQLLTDLSDVAASEPGVSEDWAEITGGVSFDTGDSLVLEEGVLGINPSWDATFSDNPLKVYNHQNNPERSSMLWGRESLTSIQFDDEGVSGTKVICIGIHSLSSVTEAQNIIALGHYAGADVVDATETLLVGEWSGAGLVDGWANSFIGHGAGHAPGFPYDLHEQCQENLIIGYWAQNDFLKNNNTVIGNYSLVGPESTDSTVVGWNISTDGDEIVAIGSGVSALGEQSAAIGFQASCGEMGAVSIGWGTEAEGPGAIALGRDSLAEGERSIAIGSAIGQWDDPAVTAGGAECAIAIGADTYSGPHVGGTAIGWYSRADDYGTAVGFDARVYPPEEGGNWGNNLALGYFAYCDHWLSAAIGPNASTSRDEQIVIGHSDHDVTIPGDVEFEGAFRRDFDHLGTVALQDGTATVNTPAVTANSIIQLTIQDPGAGNIGVHYIDGRNVGQDFTISSTDGSDDSVVGWDIKEPLN